MSTTDTRAAFEKRFGPNDSFAWRDENDNYKVASLQSAWEVWQAATEAAKAEQQGEDKPVMYCVPDKSGKPLFGKGWMFSPIPQLAATMPLYTRPAAKATGTAGELPGMWEPADLVGGETDMPLAARQPAPVVAVKTWKKFLEDSGVDIGDGIDMDHPIIKAMKTEIAELRATNRSQP